ncbi:hypothetical protein C8Q78DRAFT_608288 [Trametes maxima]|nr:hypothetical protein C8Q78DRAFT_608288 [Trametes maxima]
MSLPGSRLSLTNTGTPSSTGDSPSPTPSFTFTNVPFADTCTSATITWNYSGPQENFSLFASSSITPHTGITNEVAISNACIVLNLDTTSQSFNWSPVNLTGGWYTMLATGSGFAVTSSQFFIANGTETSCITGWPPSSSTSSASAPPTTAPSGIATSGTTTPTSSNTPVPIPVSGAVSSRARTGAIAGGVIGGVVILAAAIAAYVFFGLCRRSPTRSRRGSGRQGQMGRWGGLSSRDSGVDSLPVSNAPIAGKSPLVLGLPTRRATTDSTGAILAPLANAARGQSTNSRGTSDEDVSTIGDEEKVVASRGFEFNQGVPPLPASNHRRSSLSTTSPPVTPISEPPSARGSYGRTRAKSSSQSHRALALARLDGESSASPPSSVPPTPRTRSPTSPRRSIDSTQLRTFDGQAMPLQAVSGPFVAAAAMNRTSSGNGPRRAVRKPVPTLDESDMLPSAAAFAPSLTSSSSTTVSRGPSTSSSRGGSLSPVLPHPMYRNKSGSGSGSTLRAPGVSPAPGRQHSREDLMAAGALHHPGHASSAP